MKASLFSFHLNARKKLRFGFAVIRAGDEPTGECEFHCGVASMGNENTKMWSDFQREETTKLTFRELAPLSGRTTGANNCIEKNEKGH